MDFDKLLTRAKAIVLTPRTEWPVIAAESTTPADLYKNYIVLLAAIPAVFAFIKGSVFGYDVPMIGTMRVSMGAGLFGMLLSYALTLVQVYVIALIVDVLAPTFKGERNQIQALKLAAYAFTASWLAGVAQILPWIGALVALVGGIYSIYLFYLGLPTLMKCPQDQAIGYTVGLHHRRDSDRCRHRICGGFDYRRRESGPDKRFPDRVRQGQPGRPARLVGEADGGGIQTGRGGTRIRRPTSAKRSGWQDVGHRA